MQEACQEWNIQNIYMRGAVWWVFGVGEIFWLLLLGFIGFFVVFSGCFWCFLVNRIRTGDMESML